MLLPLAAVGDLEQLYEQWLQSQKPGWSEEASSGGARENGKQIHMPTDYAEEVVSHLHRQGQRDWDRGRERDRGTGNGTGTERLGHGGTGTEAGRGARCVGKAFLAMCTRGAGLWASASHVLANASGALVKNLKWECNKKVS